MTLTSHESSLLKIPLCVKGSVQKDYITFVDIYIPNIGATKYRKKIFTDLWGAIDNIIIGNFNIPLT